MRQTCTRIRRALTHAVDLPHLCRAVLVMLPALLCYGLNGDADALKAGLVGVWMLIPTESIAPAALLLVLHAGAIGLAITLFCLALPYPWLFVPLCAASMACAQSLYRRGQAWGAMGLYCFIPALYIGCELNAAPHPFAALRHMLSWTPLIVLPVALASWARTCPPFSPGANLSQAWRSYWRRRALLPLAPPGPEACRVANDSAATRALAVLCAAALVEGLGVRNGEWMIWSAATVALGVPATARRKHQDRLWGALCGVLLGLAVAPWLIQSKLLYSLAILTIAVSLQSFRSYRFAVLTRCLLCVVAAVSIGETIDIAGLRLINVVVGGLTGIATTTLYQWLMPRLRLRLRLRP